MVLLVFVPMQLTVSLSTLLWTTRWHDDYSTCKVTESDSVDSSLAQQVEGVNLTVKLLPWGFQESICFSLPRSSTVISKHTSNDMTNLRMTNRMTKLRGWYCQCQPELPRNLQRLVNSEGLPYESISLRRRLVCHHIGLTNSLSINWAGMETE